MAASTAGRVRSGSKVIRQPVVSAPASVAVGASVPLPPSSSSSPHAAVPRASASTAPTASARVFLIEGPPCCSRWVAAIATVAVVGIGGYLIYEWNQYSQVVSLANTMAPGGGAVLEQQLPFMTYVLMNLGFETGNAQQQATFDGIQQILQNPQLTSGGAATPGVTPTMLQSQAPTSVTVAPPSTATTVGTVPAVTVVSAVPQPGTSSSPTGLLPGSHTRLIGGGGHR